MPTGKGPARIAIEDFLDTFGIGDKISAFFTRKVENFEQSIRAAFMALIDKQIAALGGDAETIADLHTILGGTHQGGITALAGFGSQMGMGAASGLMAPLIRLINYSMDRKRHTARFDPSTAIQAMWRGHDKPDALLNGMLDLGWSEDNIRAWTILLSPMLGVGEQLALWRRGEITEADLRKGLHEGGWSEDRISKLIKVTDVIPQVGDLIRMQVRDAWNMEAITKFGYDQGDRSQVKLWAAKQGLSADWVDRYWFSHWELPSPSLAFEMLHRLRPGKSDTPFTIEDLRLLLKTADYAPNFIEKVINVSFQPFTRVDIRRMYSAGIFTKDDVQSAHLDIGYSEENATKLTEFVTRDVQTEEKGITQAAIVGAYKRKVYTRAEAEAALAEIGYTGDTAKFYLDMADYDLEQALLKDEIERVEFLYVESEIESDGVYSALGKFNLPSEQVQALLVKWDIARKKKIKLPTEGDLEDLYKKNIITRDKLSDTLKRKGYDVERLDWYQRRLDITLVDEAAKAAQDAQKEQDRIALSEKVTQYQKDTADIDVTIALDKLEVANIKLALNDIEDEAEQAVYTDRIKAITIELAELAVQKAQLRRQVLE